jgi:hypothetical protein
MATGAANAAAMRAAGAAAPAGRSLDAGLRAMHDAASRARSAAAASSGITTASSADDGITDPKMRLLALLVEALTGRKVRVIDPAAVQTNAQATAQQAGDQATAGQTAAQAGTDSSPAPAQPAGWGVDVRVEQVHQETETTAYTATGQVATAAGETINFTYQASMHRDLTQSVTAQIQAGDAIKKVDPIALNLDGGTAALSDARTGFDINSDGKAEQVALPAAGTYFVALDRNGNGRVDNGMELFGPASGNGFAEIRSLDTDGNGWIDSGDTAYASLRLWSGPDATMRSLQEAGVGALYVGASTATKFDLRSGTNETLGQVISSGVYLADSGRPGALQQVDLTA